MTFSEWYAANVEPGVIQTVNAIPDKATRELTLKAARDSMAACWNAALEAQLEIFKDGLPTSTEVVRRTVALKVKP